MYTRQSVTTGFRNGQISEIVRTSSDVKDANSTGMSFGAGHCSLPTMATVALKFVCYTWYR